MRVRFRGGRSIFAMLWLACCFSVVAAENGARSEELLLPGLTAPVEIITDRWGIAHIYAENEADLFFAQGFSAARDRTFQFEMWRRQATGTVAEILGRRELDRDIGARLLRFRGDLKTELNHYHPQGEAIITAYVRGVNAWIDQTRQNPELLSLEFELLGIRPEYWTPEVVVSRHQGLVFNLEQELGLGRAVALLGANKVLELVDFHPGEPNVTLDEKIDGQHLFADILKLYRASRSPIRFESGDLATASNTRQNSNILQASANFDLHLPFDSGSPLSPFLIDDPDVGSNNWVVSGSHTKSGKPLLANDPHRVLHVPSLRYFVHLSAPGWNVIGGGEPVLPGVSIGHNEHGSWGLTIHRIDAEDLYFYETDPDNPSRYRYGDGWETMRTVVESIPIRGVPNETVELRYTRHGPVLHADSEQHVAFALRAGWLEVGAAPYLASLRMNVARNWEEFREACSYSRLPGLNMVWADRHGEIGWQVVGVSPVRRNWNGLVPVPGDGRYEWDGYLPIPQLPNIHNPEHGFWNTSNENLIDANHPHRNNVGWTWADSYRGDRVREVLAAAREHTVADMARLQQDVVSLPARQLVPLLIRAVGDDPQYRDALELFSGWDFALTTTSSAAGLYVMCERRVEENLRELLVPDEAREHLPALSMRDMLAWLSQPDERFGSDPTSERDKLLLTSLAEAVADLTSRFGEQTTNWQYGQVEYKHSLIQHPLSKLVDEETRNKLDVGPLPRGGNGYTVNNTGRPNRQPTGASFRVVVDTADWDNSLGSNSPGQSGNPDSPHYRDLFEPWATDQHFPLLYSRDKIEAAAGKRTLLKPAVKSP